MFISVKLKVTMYFFFFNGCTHLPCAPTRLLLTSSEKKKMFGKNEHYLYFDTRTFSFILVLTSEKVMIDVSRDLVTLALVSKGQNTAED